MAKQKSTPKDVILEVKPIGIPETSIFIPKDVWDFDGRDNKLKYSWVSMHDGNMLKRAAVSGYKAVSGKEEPKVKGDYLLMARSI